MMYMWQKDWFNIQFSDICKLDPLNLATNDFYDKFYEKFYSKYSNYQELPKQWRDEKLKVVSFLSEIINNKKNILSIGCGNGFIETELSKLDYSKKLGGGIVSIEPSINASKWLNNELSIVHLMGYFPQALKDTKYNDFDFVYTSAIDYVFNDKEYIKFIKSIRDYCIKDVCFINLTIHAGGFFNDLKSKLNMFLHRIGFHRRQEQFWGYKRTMNEQINCFKKAGFLNISYGCIDEKIYWIRCKDE
ncbi:hypothetical protein [Campylobacter hyointestinalis]|uniref:hypothetical protein n=1 Tax=Campylobacter hyointestinalis TaxID=198 RepID=UPI0011ABA4AB|nr:hypothetical protein [Campylobacter hyointestinalis]TWO30526.1 hypothetical protein YZ79_02600 [Campylobacter hyointestinalis]